MRRGLVDSAYNDRRRECIEAASIIGVSSLRDADMLDVENAKAALGPVRYRRARHVVSENERTLQAADALRGGDMDVVGRCMAESHRSLDEDFEVTVPAMKPWSNSLTRRRGGVRMTGGGFGGCVVCVAPTERVNDIRQVVADGYHDNGLHADVYVCWR